ncbi:MAG: porin family protein [Halomonas sp.]|nr:outer membrane beta-barrel protein [Halomonas sp.]MBR2513887.1 porin family protein [Halomonas sp.]
MKKSAKVFVITSSLLLASAAQAQSFQAGYPQGYIGADAMVWNLNFKGLNADSLGVDSFDAEMLNELGLNIDDLDNDYRSEALRLVAGIKLDKYLAVELHAATGGSDSNGGFGLELDYLISGFLKGIVPLGSHARLFGLLGYSEVKMTASALGMKDSGRDDDVSFGAGAEFDVSDTLSLTGDVTRYISNSDYDLDAYSIGLRYRF